MQNLSREYNCITQASGRNWSLYCADSVDFARSIPANSVDVSVYSPPFSNLYIYSDSERDMGNCQNDNEFIEQYRFLLTEMHRIMRPGRLCAVHCKDLVNYKGRDGMAGLRDFPGEIIRAHESAGFSYHARVTIWKDPVIEMQRTKAHGLLYKQLRKDSTFSRVGLAEYVLLFRKWPKNDTEEKLIRPVEHTKSGFPLDQWQQWASPVWMDIVQTDVLNIQLARDSQDEKHICPLQLGLIERCYALWSNEGDVAFSPFTGIGSEGVVALRTGRKFIGCELKPTYFNHAAKNLANEEDNAGRQQVMFQ